MKTYFVGEIQNNTTTIYDFADMRQAEAKYHYILSFAAVSDVEKHGAIMFDNNGTFYYSNVYEHTASAD